MTTYKEGITLERSIGKISATLLTASMIIGTGIFAAVGSATAFAGSGLLLSMVIGGIIALATGISASQLGVNFPKEGGAFTWAREFNHKTLSFIAGISYLGKAIVSLGVISLAFATYTANFFPPIPTQVLASLALLFAIVLNRLGIKLTSRVLIILASLNVLLLLVFVILGFHSVNIKNLFPLTGKGTAGVLTGAAIFFWTWDGFMRTAIMASEIKNPRKSIPYAVVGGIAIAAVIYLLVAGTTIGILGANATGNTDSPLLKAAVISIGNWSAIIILAAAWIATLSEMLGDLLSASRVVFAMGKEGELPKWAGVVDLKSKSPRNAILGFGVVCIFLVLVFPNLRSLLAVASVFSITWYCITHYSALQLPKNQRIAPIAFSWFGLLGCLLLLVSLPITPLLSGLIIIGTATILHSLLNKHNF